MKEVKKIPTRDEIDEKDKWRIEDLYSSDSEWEKDVRKLEEVLGRSCDFKGKLAQSAEMLYMGLSISDEYSLMMERIYVYAFMKYYEDTANPLCQKLSGRAQALEVQLDTYHSFMIPEILEIDTKVLKEYMNAGNGIKLYQHLINNLLLKKEHILSKQQEELLAKSKKMADASKEIFSKFNNADLNFGDIKNEDGEYVQLTHGRFGSFMQSNNRSVRKEAFETLYKAYGKFKNTLAETYYANVNQAAFYADVRKYNSSMEMYLSSSHIPPEVYKNLIQTVRGHLGLMHQYVNIRKKMLGVEQLHFYDVYAPMVNDYKMEVSYEEAKKLVKEGLACLGEKYGSIIEEGYENGWIDARENSGKRSGAFSWGAYGTHPYVFLNYADTLNDVFTLAHEMGHAIHSYLSNREQPYVYSGYKIFVAEVASTCNEALLINYMLSKCTEEKQRKYLLNHYLEQFKGTLFRQTMFAEFEMITHEMAEKGDILNSEVLCKIYRDLNEQYFGPDMEVDEEIALEWARIPHFYTPFYVYQYATGFSAAIAIASKILEGDQKVLDGYFKFLQGGSSMHPIELLKLCGVDMSKPEPIEAALNIFKSILQKI